MEDNTSVAARNSELPVGSENSAPSSAVAGVVMAAGSSRRFGGNKLLEPFRGKPLLRWVTEAALRSRLASVIVVLGHQHDRVHEALADLNGQRRLTFTINKLYEAGQSASIVAGLSAIPSNSAGAMFLVGDQPLLDSSVIDRLIVAFEASIGGICYPCCDGQRGNPVIFDQRFFSELRQLRGDVGGNAVIKAHRKAAVPVIFGDATPFRDVDRRADIDLLSFQGAAANRSVDNMTLVQALGLETSRVISLCGSGGKTSLMAALVREFASNGGERILATTTTKMGSDEVDGPWRACQATDAAALFSAVGDDSGPVLAYRFADDQRRRLLGFPAETIDAFKKGGRFTRVLVEADGSRRRPLKAPGTREPVFPASTDAVVMVAGISGLGRPLDDDAVFRPDRWSALTGLAISEFVTADSLARVIAHPDGLARGAPLHARRVLFLNQADTPDHVVTADAVLHSLSTLGRQGPERAVVGRLQPKPYVCVIRLFATRDSQNSGEGK